tara:strand:+ start:1239 stop:1748 length:510 start_codon:yes stop_codon:yes gene_type:complete
MAGIGIKRTLTGLQEVVAALSQIDIGNRDTTPMMDEIGAAMVASTQLRFEDEKDPDGNPWPPSIRAKAEGGQTLTNRARLRQSQTHNASERKVEWGTDLIYAAIHQLGGTIRAKGGGKLKFKIPGGGFAQVDQVTIPARPYLGVNAENEAEILAIVSDWITRETQGAVL